MTPDEARFLVGARTAVLATIDLALAAEDRSFTSPELRSNIDRFLARDQSGRAR